MEFNINDYVLVRLTDHGRKILKQNHDELYEHYFNGDKPEYSPITEDKDGFSQWQLWRLMSALGKHCIMGCNQPFETTIKIESSK